MSNILFVLLTLLVNIEVVRVTAISLTISPDHVTVTESPQSVTFTCAADVALAGCQFRWLHKHNSPGPLLQLSRGSQSQADPAHLNTYSLTNYSYHGRGLGAGDCGVSLHVKGFKRLMVACRVRAESGGWTYAWADLFVYDRAPLPHNLKTPKEVVVLPGGEARFSLEAGQPLYACYFFPPSKSNGLVFDEGHNSPDSTGRHRYIGTGLRNGECGLTLTSVSEADNGPVRCWITIPTHKVDNRFMALVVARTQNGVHIQVGRQELIGPPTEPTLSLAYTGTNVTATCEVKASRPVAKISWVLGDDIIRQDENDDTQAGPQDEWRWPWMQGSIQQTLTLQLQPQHNGKDLKCRVSHIALAQPLEAKSTVSFAEPTKSTTPVNTASTTPENTSGITTSATTSTNTITTHVTTTSTTPGQKCISGNILDLLCQQNRLQATQLANTSCPNDVYAFHVREAGAKARTAEMLEEVAKAEKSAKAMKAVIDMEVAQISQEAARSHARAEEDNAMAAEKAINAAEVTYKLAEDAARSHARAEEAWAKNAEEELQYERERRART